MTKFIQCTEFLLLSTCIFLFFDIFSKALNKIAISSKFHSEKIKWEKLQNFPSTNAFLICMKIREKEIKKKHETPIYAGDIFE